MLGAGITILVFIAGIVVGYFAALQPKWRVFLVHRAIQKYFQLKKNEYALEYDADENSYFVTTNNQLFAVKLSNQHPLQVVSTIELEPY